MDLPGDIISIKELQLPYGVVSPDVWGKPKEQPALLSISLTLRHPFKSAADQDALDASTIHYGELAKRIRASCIQNMTAGQVSAAAERAACEMAQKSAGNFIVSIIAIELILGKASMYGAGLVLGTVSYYDESGRVARPGQRTFTVRDVKIMTLVGVNQYERAQKQPIVATCTIFIGSMSGMQGSEQTVALFNLENTLVQIIEATQFETLETLAEFTVREMQKRMLNAVLPGSAVQLRLEKPRAIAFADSPAVEIFRETPGDGQPI
ncbi:Dihydroneopterin aldolase [Teratosphaeria destructans]|uniref:dihydroneopterin aldolase n=1 Tax=Teratosphaeria destructans TaxID=418781 RepID=A0A9W7STH7_9PEZI|nr:Dihydroneopterin aldolase [Teratosphaeria destructans]